MKTQQTFLVLVVAALAISGCGNREKQLVGKWTGKLTMPAGQKDDMATKMAEAMMSNISLELKEDKKFVLTMMFPLEGTWSTSGNTVELKVEKFMGMTVDQMKEAAKGKPNADKMDEMNKPMQLSISDDGKTLKVMNKGPLSTGSSKQGDLVFTKST